MSCTWRSLDMAVVFRFPSLSLAFHSSLAWWYISNKYYSISVPLINKLPKIVIQSLPYKETPKNVNRNWVAIQILYCCCEVQTALQMSFKSLILKKRVLTILVDFDRNSILFIRQFLLEFMVLTFQQPITSDTLALG